MRHTRTACSGHAAKNGFVLHRIFVLLTLIGSHSMFAYHFFFFGTFLFAIIFFAMNMSANVRLNAEANTLCDTCTERCSA